MHTDFEEALAYVVQPHAVGNDGRRTIGVLQIGLHAQDCASTLTRLLDIAIRVVEQSTRFTKHVLSSSAWHGVRTVLDYDGLGAGNLRVAVRQLGDRSFAVAGLSVSAVEDALDDPGEGAAICDHGDHGRKTIGETGDRAKLALTLCVRVLLRKKFDVAACWVGGDQAG